MEERLGSERYQMWFSSLSLVEDTGSKLTFGVPNLFIRDWVERKFMEDLRAAVRDVVESERAIDLRVDGELFRQFRKDEAEFRARNPVPEGEETGAGADAKGAETSPRIEIAGGLTIGGERKPAALYGLNDRLSFETFIAGASNNVALSASMSVLRSPGRAYSPLFVYAETGLGKTHLLQA